jgi:hypothetical protein
MNDRIKQLALRANLTEVIDSAYLERNDWQLFVGKFAELIVEECASKVDNILREKKDGGGTMGDDIREHFGVKE